MEEAWGRLQAFCARQAFRRDGVAFRSVLDSSQVAFVIRRRFPATAMINVFQQFDGNSSVLIEKMYSLSMKAPIVMCHIDGHNMDVEETAMALAGWRKAVSVAARVWTRMGRDFMTPCVADLDALAAWLESADEVEEDSAAW